MRHRLMLEKYKLNNFKCLQVHIYIPINIHGDFYLRWADQTKFTIPWQMISHKKVLFKKKKIASPVRTRIIAFFHES